MRLTNFIPIQLDNSEFCQGMRNGFNLVNLRVRDHVKRNIAKEVHYIHIVHHGFSNTSFLCLTFWIFESFSNKNMPKDFSEFDHTMQTLGAH